MKGPIAILALAFATSACGLSEDDGLDELAASESDGKADGATIQYRLKRSEAGYRPLNEALDEWVHGLFNAVHTDAGAYEVVGPWYKVTPNLAAPTWWRMDVRPPEGDAKLPDIADKRVAFFVLWRMVGDSAWTFLRPEVTTGTGAASTGLFTSFKVDRGTLEVTSPAFTGTATSDFYWNDIEPEFAFVPVPWETPAKMPGIGQFEISITEAE